MMKSIDLSIPENVIVPVRTLLVNEKTGRIHHGALSRLTTDLIEEWIEELRKDGNNG